MSATVQLLRRPVRSVAVLVAVAAAALASACGTGSGKTPAAQELRIYNWADYIGKNTIPDFEAQTGIKVTYDTYDADETLEAKMMAGDSGYDVVSTSTDFFSRQIKAGIYQPLDRAKLPNWFRWRPMSWSHPLALQWQRYYGRHGLYRSCLWE